MTDMTKAQLIQYYGLSVDDFGRYTAIAEPKLLLTNTFRQAGLALSDERNFSDDDHDYTNAAIDQLQALHMMIFELPDIDQEQAILDLLNLNEDDARANESHAYGFVYGYADHASHISDLAHMNDED